MISSLELARLCGVSQGTVDRALHGRPGISATTRERILLAAAEHGHRPHPAAREILTGQSRFVQAALPAVNNPFFMDIADSLATALEARDLSLQIAIVKKEAQLLTLLEDAAARRHRLAVFIPPEEGITIPDILTRNLPMAALLSPCAGTNVPFLSPDEDRTGNDGVDYLYGLGHRDIVHLTYPRQAHAVAARANGYCRRMRELNLPPCIVTSTELDAVLSKRSRPTAIFCHNDWLALQAVLALRAEGISVPEEISVLGVDNSPTFTALFSDLTTMAYPVEALVGAILSRLDGGTHTLKEARFPIVPRLTVAKRIA